MQGQAPVLELGTRRSRHCHTRGVTGHPGQQQRARRKLYLAAGICLVFMVGEAVGEWWVQGPAGVVPMGVPRVAARSPSCPNFPPWAQAGCGQGSPLLFGWSKRPAGSPPTLALGDLVHAWFGVGSLLDATPMSPRPPHPPQVGTWRTAWPS